MVAELPGKVPDGDEPVTSCTQPTADAVMDPLEAVGDVPSASASDDTSLRATLASSASVDLSLDDGFGTGPIADPGLSLLGHSADDVDDDACAELETF